MGTNEENLHIHLATSEENPNSRLTSEDTFQSPSWKDASGSAETNRHTNGGYDKDGSARGEHDVEEEDEEEEEDDEEEEGEGEEKGTEVGEEDDEDEEDQEDDDEDDDDDDDGNRSFSSSSHSSDDDLADGEEEDDEDDNYQQSEKDALHRGNQGEKSSEYLPGYGRQPGPDEVSVKSEQSENLYNNASSQNPPANLYYERNKGQRDRVGEGENEEEEDVAEDEEEDDDDDDVEEGDDQDDRLKETQDLVAKIEHDIEGLRFQAKQRGHLLADVHRYSAQNKQSALTQDAPSSANPSLPDCPQFQEHLEYPNQEEHPESLNPQTLRVNLQDITATPEYLGRQGGEEVARIEKKPPSIKLRLRTRSTSPKSQRGLYSPLSMGPIKAGRVKMRPMRIGNQLGRWEAWKERMAVKNDRDLAKLVLDHMDRTYFQQFIPPARSTKAEKRKKSLHVHNKKAKKAKKEKVAKVAKRQAIWYDEDAVVEDDLDDLFDPPVEEKDDYDYDPSVDSDYKPNKVTAVRNKRKSQRPRKLVGVSTSPKTNKAPKVPKVPKVPKSPKLPKPPKPPKAPRVPKAPKPPREKLLDAAGLPIKRKRGRKAKLKPAVEVHKVPNPRKHGGGRQMTLATKLRRLDWNGFPRRYECKICCLRIDGIVAFRAHLESAHRAEYFKSEESSADKAAGEGDSHNVDRGKKQYQDLDELQGQHMQDPRHRPSENDAYRHLANAYGQDMLDARRFEMMPPLKRHLHENYSNEWGKVPGNIYSRPPGQPGQMIPGEQPWGHGGRGYDGMYPNVITSLGQMSADGVGIGQRSHHQEGYLPHGGNMMRLQEQGPSHQDNAYADMSMRQQGDGRQGVQDMSQERTQRTEELESGSTPDVQPPPKPLDPSIEQPKEAEEEEKEKEEEEDADEVKMKPKQKKWRMPKGFKEWEHIDRWAITYVLCPQCEEYIRFRPGKKNLHIKVHAERRLCTECGKMFAKEAFRAHQRSHEEDREGTIQQHMCEICGKEFRYKCSLNSHLRTHSDQREYECKICGKKFPSAHNLEKHELVHRKVKPHQCPECGRGFTQYHNMLAHRRQHTGEKPYRCDLCDRSFTHNVSLKNHKKKEHGVDLWSGSGSERPPPVAPSSRQRGKSSRNAQPPLPPPPECNNPPLPPQPKLHVPSERELMHTLDPAQLYGMMPPLEYAHY